MGERTITNILSKREPKHNRSIYRQNGYFGENVVLMLRFFKGGEFFNTLTDLERAEIVAMSSYRTLFNHFYDFQGDADAMIYESEDASVFATVRADSDLYALKEDREKLCQYSIGDSLYIPIDEYIKCECLGCSDLVKELVSRFVKHYNIKPFTKENYLALEKKFFSKEGQDALNESNNAFIRERFCNPDDYSSFVTSFRTTPLGKDFDELRMRFHYMGYVGDVIYTFSNDREPIFVPSYPLTVIDELDVTKPLTSFASLLSFVPTKEGVEHDDHYEEFVEKDSPLLNSYARANRDAIQRLREDFQQHSDIPLFEGVDEKVAIKCFALMSLAFEVRSFCRENYARRRALIA